MNNFQFSIYLLDVFLVVLFIYNIGRPFAVFILIMLIFLLLNYSTSFLGSSWLGVPENTAKRMVRIGNVKNRKVYDLGSGDGRLVLEAAKNGADACGIEIEPLKWLLSSLRLRGLKNAKVKCCSFFSADINDADIVFMFLPQETVDRLQPKLSTLRKGARVVSHSSICKGLKIIKEYKKEKIYVYSVR